MIGESDMAGKGEVPEPSKGQKTKSQERGQRSSWCQALGLVLLFLGWSVPAAVFWSAAVSHDVVLAIVPYVAWLVPGGVWIFSRSLAIGALLVLSVLLGWYGLRGLPKPLVPFVWVFLGTMVLINVLWGTALLGVAGGR